MNPRRPFPSRRSGQVLLFLVLVVVVLTFAGLWVFDVNKILFVKARARNGGDAAALAAARWQGTTLNLIGDLNVMQAVAISDALASGSGDFSQAAAIADLQSRAAFAGPMAGFVAAQQAAKANGIYANDAMTADMREHARIVRDEYVRFYPSAYTPLPPATTSWEDYANMLEAAANDGVAAACDNIQYYATYSNDSHMLLNPQFYEAIAGREWCWFWWNARDLLFSYTSWMDWPPLPEIQLAQPVNSEIFNLNVAPVPFLDRMGGGGGRGGSYVQVLSDLAGQALDPGIVDVPARWFFYRMEAWGAWTDLIPEGFPFDGEIRPEYNYAGADAAVRIQETSTRRSDSAGANVITWSAAGKPFGTLEESTIPTRHGLVLRAFDEVRLIPVDASSAPAGAVRPGWLTFIYDILPLYMQRGPVALPPDNWYAQQLLTWESPLFRRQGVEWLNDHSENCIVRGGGGGGGSGGTRRGH
ncbi:MAG: pilus assembly protein TadG-related protein [Kiritimatiellia bacterium]